MTRKDFLSAVGASAAMSVLPSALATEDGKKRTKAVLLHLGANMWCDWVPDGQDDSHLKGQARPERALSLDEAVFHRVTEHAAVRGMNMVVLDIGEALVYPSHPELAVQGSWTPDRMRTEIARLRGLGLEVIPKLNFSNTHNGWLKGLRRQVSTPAYYAACSDVIRDVVEIFDRPRMLHLGYDEETAGHQAALDFVVVRKGELWWHDFLWFVGVTEKLGVRPWVWSDYGWHHPEYVKRCPKSVMQSNWYYDEDLGGFSLDQAKNRYWDILQLYVDLEKAGFEQIPCGSNWLSSKHKANGRIVNESMVPLMDYCRERIAPERLKGFMMASWAPCKPGEKEGFIRAGIDLVANRM